MAVSGEVEGEIELGSEELHAVLMLEPVLITAVVPFGDVLLGNLVWERRVGGFIEALNDLSVGGAVGEELVDEVAEFFGEAGDFAVAAGAAGGKK